MKKPKLVSVCGDAGGAKAIAPVLKVLESDGRFDLINYVYDVGLRILNDQRIPNAPLPEAIDAPWTRRRLQEDCPSLVLSGTSHNARNCEKLFISAARELRMPSVAVLDFWSSYVERFSHDGKTLTALPDTIAVMDQRAKSEMEKAGFPAGAIVITGHPDYDSLEPCRRGFSAARNSELRNSLGAADSDLFVLFASQPLKDRNPGLGIDEHAVLADVIGALEMIFEHESRTISLLIRPHPREKPEDFQRHRSRTIRLIVSADGDERELAMSSDLVVGMNSQLLMQACYLGCVVLSLQPGLRSADPLPSNDWGVSRGVYARDQIAPTLKDLLLDERARREARTRCAGLQLDGRASRRIADHIYTMITEANS
jgi:hypothetical protein